MFLKYLQLFWKNVAIRDVRDKSQRWHVRVDLFKSITEFHGVDCKSYMTKLKIH